MTKKYSPHIFALCALFVMGNTVFSHHFYKTGLLSFFVSSALLFLLAFLSLAFLKLGIKNKVVFYISAIGICVFAIYGAVTSATDFVNLLKSTILQNTSPFLLWAIVLCVVVCFAFASSVALYKYCLFVSVICGVIIAICFIGGIKIFDFSAFMVLTKPVLEIKRSLGCFLPVVVLPFFIDDKSYNFKPAFYGIGAGVFATILCLFQSVFTFGTIEGVSYPYLMAVGVISSGSLFTRLDGLVYFLFFVTSIVKTVVCVKTLKKTITSLP